MRPGLPYITNTLPSYPKQQIATTQQITSCRHSYTNTTFTSCPTANYNNTTIYIMTSFLHQHNFYIISNSKLQQHNNLHNDVIFSPTQRLHHVQQQFAPTQSFPKLNAQQGVPDVGPACINLATTKSQPIRSKHHILPNPRSPLPRTHQGIPEAGLVLHHVQKHQIIHRI